MKGAIFRVWVCVFEGRGEWMSVSFSVFSGFCQDASMKTPTASSAAGYHILDFFFCLFCASNWKEKKENMYLPHIVSHIHASIHLHNFPEGIKKVVVELLCM